MCLLQTGLGVDDVWRHQDRHHHSLRRRRCRSSTVLRSWTRHQGASVERSSTVDGMRHQGASALSDRAFDRGMYLRKPLKTSTPVTGNPAKIRQKREGGTGSENNATVYKSVVAEVIKTLQHPSKEIEIRLRP